jgi:hypothetical protein
MENLTEQMALDFLKSKGFYTDCLFHRDMIKNKYNINNEQADAILKDVVEQDGLWEIIYDGIDFLCENNYKEFANLTEFDILEMSLEEVINYLHWCDRNHDFTQLTLDEAREFAIRFILFEEIDSEEFGHPTENQHFLNELLKK